MDASQRPVDFDPADVQGEQHVLLLFAPSERSPAYQAQVELLEEFAGEQEAHDLLVARIMLEGDSYVGRRKMAPEAAARLREAYDVGTESFCLVVIDKSGTELRRDDTPLQPEAIYDMLDASTDNT